MNKDRRAKLKTTCRIICRRHKSYKLHVVYSVSHLTLTCHSVILTLTCLSSVDIYLNVNVMILICRVYHKADMNQIHIR